MRICHVTPHLPPDQAANALLPVHLGRWASQAGHHVAYVSHPAAPGPANRLRQGYGESRRSALRAKAEAGFHDRSAEDEPRGLPGSLVTVPRRTTRPGLIRRARSLFDARRISRLVSQTIASADLVHVHGNGLLSETCAVLAARRHKPVVMTLYGTEIWHYRRKRPVDLFTRAYRAASAVTFYSDALLARARELGLDHRRASVMYPLVAPEFQPSSDDDRRRVRHELGVGGHPLLVNVKRLHPLGGHIHLIDAMTTIAEAVPNVRLMICGAGSLRGELESRVRERMLERSVQFTGLVDNAVVAAYDGASDLFVLSSLLEACPTVALEALACGTPVISTDNPGGVELHALFGDDVRVVPRENPQALASAVIDALGAPRRVLPDTRRRIEQDFRLDAVGARYLDLYCQVCCATQT